MSAKYTTIDELFVVLEWLMNQRPDSVYSHFNMFQVAFDNPQLLGSTFGVGAAMRQLNQFGATLAAGLRRSDLVGRDFADFWILSPECNSDMVGCRLCEIAEKVEQFGLDVVKCSIGAYVFPLAPAELTSARMLLDRLKTLPPAYKFDPTKDCGMALAAKKGDGSAKWSGRSPENCVRARRGDRPAGSG